MKPKRSHLFRLALCGTISLGLSGNAIRAAAEEPVPAAITRPGPEASQSEQGAYWRARADEARARVAAAQTELDAANAAVSRMRRNNHPRGEARIRLREEQARARKALEQARRYLEVELPAEAREAGVARHWLRERG